MEVQNDSSPVRIGMIGAGKFARSLAEVAATIPELRIVAVCDLVPENALALARDFGLDRCADSAALVQRADVDAVIISTSHAMHAPNTLEAVAAGKHVFGEKPMALTVDECLRMIEAARQAGVKLLIGQVTRLLPMTQRLRAILDQNLIGQPVAMHMMRSGWFERRGWWASVEQSGGMLHSHGAHMYDFVNSVLGQPTRIYAITGPRVQPQIDFDDTIFSTITYQSGAIGSVNASISGQQWLYRGGVIADGGSLEFELALDGCSLSYQPRGGQPVCENFGTFDQECLDGMRVELQNFAAMVRADAPPFVVPEQAALAVGMISAAYESIRRGAPVRL